jgi:branched-chain amino acid transport system ATP-binding protein
VTPPGARAPLVELASVSKDYHGLRPLRIEQLSIPESAQTALLGFDVPMAETFVNLVTGAALPDQGVVTIWGRPTAAIADSAEWLAVVDRFGIVSSRAVLLLALSVTQNLAMPFTLNIDPPPDDILARAVQLAIEAGIPEPEWSRAVGDLDAAGRFRLRVARALALDPGILLLEHATAELPRGAVSGLGAHVRQIAARRGCAVLSIGADAEFASAVASRVLLLDAATGRFSEPRRKWSFFGRGR